MYLSKVNAGHLCLLVIVDHFLLNLNFFVVAPSS